MRIVRYTKRFRRDYAKAKRVGKKMLKLHVIMEMLMDGEPLLARHRDHALQGEWQHLRDCHIEGDWILLYEIESHDRGNEVLTFHATGTHGYLFG